MEFIYTDYETYYINEIIYDEDYSYSDNYENEEDNDWMDY